MDNSPLARLPRELRDHIYELVLSFKSHLYLHDDDPDNPARLPCGQLTRVCRQLRAETQPIFYSSNKFMVNALWKPATEIRLAAGLRALGPEIVCRIRQIYICWHHQTSYINSGMGKEQSIADVAGDADVVKMSAHDTLLPPPIAAAYRDMGLVLHDKCTCWGGMFGSEKKLVVTSSAGLLAEGSSRS